MSRRAYLDASALVKLVLHEPESPALARYVAEVSTIMTSSVAATATPCARPCAATSAARLMSSYDEFVQLPISATEIRSTKPFCGSRTSAASCDSGRARSGECGPTTCGSSRDRSSSSTRS